MGAPIARRLELAGHELLVWNRSPGPAASSSSGAFPCSRAPAEALQRAEVCIAMLADLAALESGHARVRAGSWRTPTAARLVEHEHDLRRRLGSGRRRGRPARRRLPAGAGERQPVRSSRRANLAIIVSGDARTFDELSAPCWATSARIFLRRRGRAGPRRQARAQPDDRRHDAVAGRGARARRGERDRRRPILEVMGGSAMGSPFVKYKTDALVARRLHVDLQRRVDGEGPEPRARSRRRRTASRWS